MFKRITKDIVKMLVEFMKLEKFIYFKYLLGSMSVNFKIDMGSEYSSTAAFMTGGLRKLLEGKKDEIPRAYLNHAINLFDSSIIFIKNEQGKSDIPPSHRNVVSFNLIATHIEGSHPTEYFTQFDLYEKVLSYKTLLEKIANSENISENTNCIKSLRKFFDHLAKKSEEVAYLNYQGCYSRFTYSC